MANSKFAYVRDFELPDPLLPGTFMVLRLDGRSFHGFSDAHKFDKPNDKRALELMDHAARDVMENYPDIVLAFGESDEYSFLFRKSTTLYNRRQSKIVSTLTSLFTSSYVFHWGSHFPDNPLQYPPSFDGRIVLYPGEKQVRDYFSWRQADTHINNLYNTIFWALVLKGGESTSQAHATLKGTFSKDKHNILFSRFGINYNDIEDRYKKGSVLVRCEQAEPEVELEPLSSASSSFKTIHLTHETTQEETEGRLPVGPTSDASPIQGGSHSGNVSSGRREKSKKSKAKLQTRIDILHCDIIQDEFWQTRPSLLEG